MPYCPTKAKDLFPRLKYRCHISVSWLLAACVQQHPTPIFLESMMGNNISLEQTPDNLGFLKSFINQFSFYKHY